MELYLSTPVSHPLSREHADIAVQSATPKNTFASIKKLQHFAKITFIFLKIRKRV
jgi:hypothetical protein